MGNNFLSGHLRRRAPRPRAVRVPISDTAPRANHTEASALYVGLLVVVQAVAGSSPVAHPQERPAHTGKLVGRQNPGRLGSGPNEGPIAGRCRALRRNLRSWHRLVLTRRRKMRGLGSPFGSYRLEWQSSKPRGASSSPARGVGGTRREQETACKQQDSGSTYSTKHGEEMRGNAPLTNFEVA